MQRGDRALYAFTAQFDAPSIREWPLRVSAQEISRATDTISSDVARAIVHAIRNVRAVHTHEATHLQERSIQVERGITVAHHYSPIPSVGLYVPRGRGSFPSMLIMLAVPALLAGVKNIVVVTPPNPDGSVDTACRYVASTLGLRSIYRVGGAQAIAALTYGTHSIPKVDKIMGPGSLYVNAARFLLNQYVDTGMPAGPSESIIVADSSANPTITALDLMVEAEHGSDSLALLITDSATLASRVAQEIPARLPSIPEPRRTFVRDSLARGGVVVTATLQEALSIVDRFAPEHLKIDTRNASELATQVQCAGEILIGPHSTFSLANYAVGANAVLPTGGGARSWSGLSVRDYCIRRALVEVDEEGYRALKHDVIALAHYEQFFCHAHALSARESKEQSPQ